MKARKRKCRKRGEEMETQRSPVHSLEKAYTEELVIVEVWVETESPSDPVKLVKQFFTKEGVFIGEVPK